MSESPSPYDTFYTERLNPQFIGMAEKYSRHKKYRVETDQKKKDVESNYHYLNKLNDDLDKNLDQKKKQLMRLKKIRDRHNSDVKNVHFLMIIESGGIEKKKEDERRTAAKIK